jgi:cell division protein FtsZ
VQGISDIITIPGIINRDFADVKAIMAGMGYAVMGTAVARGNHRAVEAAQAAIASPLLEAGAIDGARGILINITGSNSLKLSEVNEASMIIQSAAHEDANIIFGAVQDERMKDEVKITVIATGFKTEGIKSPVERERALGAAAAAISTERAAAAFIPSVPKPSFKPQTMNMMTSATSTALRDVAPPRDAATHEAVRPVVADDGEDLDVPAFIRRRGAELNS